MAFLRRDEPANNSSHISTGHTHTILGPEAEFEGKLAFKGAVRIDGSFKGQIITEDTLVIGEQAKVESQASVGVLVVHGVFYGNVRASQMVELHKDARFYGEISSPSLVIENGAVFEGTCKMDHLETAQQEPRRVLSSAREAAMSGDVLEATDIKL